MARGVHEMVEDALRTVEPISVQDAKQEIDSGTAGLVVDVREPNEFEQGHLPGAINVPRGLLELRADIGSPVAHDRLLPEDPRRPLRARRGDARRDGLHERRRDAGRPRGVARRGTG